MKWRELLKELASWSEERMDQQVLISMEEEQGTGASFREVQWTAFDSETKRMFLLVGKLETKEVEFKVSHVGSDTNEFGLYEHIFISRQGHAMRAWAYRGPGGKTWEAGDTLAVPFEDGKPAFSALGFHHVEPILTGVAPVEVVREVWGGEVKA